MIKCCLNLQIFFCIHSNLTDEPMKCNQEYFERIDMITPADTNAFITDVDEQDDNGKNHKYRKLSFNIDVTNPEFPFSTCYHDGIKSKGKNHNS